MHNPGTTPGWNSISSGCASFRQAISFCHAPQQIDWYLEKEALLFKCQREGTTHWEYRGTYVKVNMPRRKYTNLIHQELDGRGQQLLKFE